MDEFFNVIPYRIQKMDDIELKQIQGGSVIEVIALGLGMMALSYQVGKDFARYTKKLESRQIEKMEKLIQLTDQELKIIEGGKKEWILTGCFISPLMACFCIGYYLEYNS